MASAARRQIIDGAPINKSRGRRLQIVGGGAARRTALYQTRITVSASLNAVPTGLKRDSSLHESFSTDH